MWLGMSSGVYWWVAEAAAAPTAAAEAPGWGLGVVAAADPAATVAAAAPVV